MLFEGEFIDFSDNSNNLDQARIAIFKIGKKKKNVFLDKKKRTSIFTSDTMYIFDLTEFI